MLDFTGLKKNLKKNTTGFKKVRLALLGDSATQFIAQAVKGMGIDYSLDIEIFEADFNQIDIQILNSGSELYHFDAESLVIFESTHKLLQKFNKITISDRRSFAEKSFLHTKKLVETLKAKSKAKVILCNYTEEDDHVFGQYANKVEESFIYQLRRLNILIQELALNTSNLFIADLSTIQNTIGRDNFWSPSIYTNTEMVISIEALPFLAQSIVQILGAFHGSFKKCLILDLDNTLWGGIIGDDGLENIQIGQLGVGKSFTEFQYWIKKLQQRGIIIAICSKNDEAIAKEPFEKHSDMVLRLDDIAVFIANWDNKPDNIRKIQKILNIGFDSMVFLDDNPFERNIVRENIPGLTIPELPEDPALYLDFLYKQNLFETVSYSVEDLQRTQQYQKEAERAISEESFTNESDFLKSLEMKSDTGPFNTFNIPRIAQLSQRSNQFNLRTIRYSEDEIRQIADSSDYLTISFSLEDKYGDNGLICAIILKKITEKNLFIDTWFMSCRVLKRGMENYVLNNIVSVAKQNGFRTVSGEYIPTPKNQMVRDHYLNLGFEYIDGVWKIEVPEYTIKESFITKKEAGDGKK